MTLGSQGMTLGGTFKMADDLTVTRMGYGAMQLAGPGVYGPPRDRDEAIAVLRKVVELGITHIDTSDYYGPHITNEIIKEALHPYADGLHLVTKVGARRAEDKSWPHARSPQELRDAVHDNLRNLGLDAIDVVNLRWGGLERPEPGSIEEAFTTLAELQQQGLIRHLGVSVMSLEQLQQAQSIAPVVCVQSLYNVAKREDEDVVEHCIREGIAYVPFFPLGGFSPLQAGELDSVAERLGATPMQVALAWLLHRAPNILLIPGTSSRGHLLENVAAADLHLDAEALKILDNLGQN